MHLRVYGCTHCGRSRGTANPQLTAAVMHLRFNVNVHTERLIRIELQMHLRLDGCTHCGRSHGTANPQLVAAACVYACVVGVIFTTSFDLRKRSRAMCPCV